MVAITLFFSIAVGIGVGIFVACDGGGIINAVSLGILSFTVTGMAVGMALLSW